MAPGNVGEVIFEVLASAFDGLNDPLGQDDEGGLDVLDVAADPGVAGDEDVPGSKILNTFYSSLQEGQSNIFY